MLVLTVLVFRPIKGQRKTFEELLEEQLKLEEQRLKTAEQQVAKTCFSLNIIHLITVYCR